MKELHITPRAGFILAKPFIMKGVFVSAREEAGAVQHSTVIAVGPNLLDDHGFERSAQCKPGDVILHKYVPDEFELNNDKYRMIHFVDVRGVWDNAHEWS